MEHTKHIFRIFILAIVVFLSFMVVRGFYVPESWGIFGNYRADSLIDKVNQKIIYGDKGSCKKCHEEITQKLYGGAHNPLPCEGCHEPLSTHAENGEKIKDMAIYRSAERCLVCHLKLDPRPKGFPQIEKEAHLQSQGIEELSPEVCLDCHESHSPKI
ncbi:MAG: hypothetical protein V2A69_13875 [Pseudomonadota bacterium]